MSNSKKLAVDKYGIKNATVRYQLSADELHQETLDKKLGVEASSGAIAINTGKFTGRSPKDRFIVKDDITKDRVWWGNINIPFEPEKFDKLYEKVVAYLSSKEIYVHDGYVCADPKYRTNIRTITELPWSNLFAFNMFLRIEDSELDSFKEDWLVVNAPGFEADPAVDGTRQANFAILNFTKKIALIGGTGYTGEIKKGIFSAMNFELPVFRNTMPMHCSANVGKDGDVAIFFGLSGTGKTTLSTDPKRELIGDDEHGWDDVGIFNFEGGCYAKTIHLSEENEPDIYRAIRRDALLENVVVRADGSVDFDDGSKTENTRVSYPIYHIDNIVKPVSRAGHATKVIFLTADAFGVLPPVSKLTPEQTKYYFLSGFTAKLAGTERGITEPTPTFSACFGAAFLTLHPTQYAQVLVKRMQAAGAEAYLVNTGWNGTGKRISIKDTRGIIDAILDGSIEKAEMGKLPIFDLAIPKALPGVDSAILDPRDTYADKAQWEAKAKDLAGRFVKNFEKYATNAEGKALIAAGPKA